MAGKPQGLHHERTELLPTLSRSASSTLMSGIRCRSSALRQNTAFGAPAAAQIGSSDHQAFIDKHRDRSGMADRRDAANCESGAGPCTKARHSCPLPARSGRRPSFIHYAIEAAGDDKYAGVVFEPPQHDGFGNLATSQPDLAGRFDWCGSGVCRELDKCWSRFRGASACSTR